MNKYLYFLFGGFLIFIAGIITFNFEISNYKYVDYLPENFEMNTDSFEIDVNDNKDYEIKKDRFNQNIVIEKVVDNSLKDKFVIEITHSKTSEAYAYFDTDEKDTKILLSNSMKLYVKDIKDIYELFKLCMKEKTVYNYKLLKYSKVKIIGSKEILDRIEIDNED